MHIAFIGFGEVGQRFAADFRASGGVRMRAYDLKFDAPNPAACLDAAQRLHVEVAPNAAAAIDGADCIISAVTADVAEDVARAAARYLAKGQVFFDVNSASPNTKQRAAEVVQGSGAHYVEGAVMGPVAAPGIRVPILAGGPFAATFAPRVNAIGMNVTAVASEFGRASAMKLCRSIMIKGMEALIIDCARAARHWGVEREVYASLAETFPATDWAATAENMSARVARHGVRRAAEMREAAHMVGELDVDPALCLSVADALLRATGGTENQEKAR